MRIMDKGSEPNEGGAQGNHDLKVEGDLGDLQVIVEDDSDDGEENTVACTNGNVPNGLIQNTNAPVIGSAVVTNSENVQFGNNTYFTGPVTIKQIIKPKAGIVNPAYENSENGPIPSQNNHTINKLYTPTSVVLSRDNLIIILMALVTVLIVVVVHDCLLTNGVMGSVVVVDKIGEQDIQLYNDLDFPFKRTATHKEKLLVSPDFLRIVSRDDWIAQPPTGRLDPIVKPVPWVIITHTATDGCHLQSECVLRVRVMQTFHIESRKWFDIGYNFLVGGDGSVYYGRGWEYIGAHTKGYNKYSIGIAFIGTYNTEVPTKHQLEACQKLIRLGVDNGYLREDYKLFGHRQFLKSLSPGDGLFNIIKQWPHFVTNVSEVTIPSY